MGWGEPQTGLAIGWCTRGGGGLLSWHSQKRDGRLREAGSYGELVSVTVPADVLAASAPAGEIVVRLEVDETVPGGLAVYSEEFGRYPLDPTLVLTQMHAHADAVTERPN